jgi:hypothetical protein
MSVGVEKRVLVAKDLKIEIVALALIFYQYTINQCLKASF